MPLMMVASMTIPVSAQPTSVGMIIVVCVGISPRKDASVTVTHEARPVPLDRAIERSIVRPMAMTTMQIDGKVRDQLAAVAEADFDGAPLGEAVRRLIKEYKFSRIMRRYEELRADPEEWASYQAEAQLTDNVAGEGLPDAREEYPEYNE
jgi:phage protein D